MSMSGRHHLPGLSNNFLVRGENSCGIVVYFLDCEETLTCKKTFIGAPIIPRLVRIDISSKADSSSAFFLCTQCTNFVIFFVCTVYDVETGRTDLILENKKQKQGENGQPTARKPFKRI